jgi:hypothetical protein
LGVRAFDGDGTQLVLLGGRGPFAKCLELFECLLAVKCFTCTRFIPAYQYPASSHLVDLEGFTVTMGRRELAYETRVSAAKIARDREHPDHQANGDEQRYAHANYAMSFTKGLEHNSTTGLIENRQHFEAFRRAIDEGYIDDFTLHVPRPPAPPKDPGNPEVLYDLRHWEAPTAGLVGDLEGPDAQAVTMPPAPALGSDELAYEMAEVYELAIVRDEPLSDFAEGTSNTKLTDSIARLNSLDYDPTNGSGRPRLVDSSGDVTAQLAFRGSSPGVDVGPYLSQFLLIGNKNKNQYTKHDVNDGFITYGPQLIDQRVPVATANNYMIDAAEWLKVQNGVQTRDNASLFDMRMKRRFISTPRDLATYVHDDALYQAYLNACLILLSMGTPFDPGFANLSGQGRSFAPGAPADGLERQAVGFALYGGPHILTLVTEVATRALKAVRYQKFNNHIRLRPEALGGRIELSQAIKNEFPVAGKAFEDMAMAIDPTVQAIKADNGNGTAFLPMAFQEGSPMHPAYGAGHATVAGACVTVLKAFFDTGSVFIARCGDEMFAPYQPGDTAVAYVSDFAPGDTTHKGHDLTPVPLANAMPLTLEGELNKLAANISIGRNMAGVHYFTDYYDSLRMGEQIAIEMLEEQAICYPTDPFILSMPTFDGGVVRIGDA